MPRKNEKQEWLEAMKKCCQTCPKCGQTWLIIGKQKNQEHVCRSCNHRFLMRLAEQVNPANLALIEPQ
ncbi:MAG TPA: hypothetical protein VEF04_11570 [Blastocatellia bacterium]|nr:hypothetical protein [Blastocatellia bacterium]